MVLYFIGLGLDGVKDITVKGLEIVKSCDVIYLEYYTSLMSCEISEMEQYYGKKIILADRNVVEVHAEKTILADALHKKVGFLVAGDILSATTHIDLVLRAKQAGIVVEYIHNVSIMTAIAETGLELYKFGKTTSMVFFEEKWKPTTAYDVTAMNLKNELHTLILLDIKADQNRFMTVNECLQQMLDIEHDKKLGIISSDTFVIGCARLGRVDSKIVYGKLSDLVLFDFGAPLHCVIIPGKLHFMEEEFVKQYLI